VRIVGDRLLADNEDYRLPVNTLDVAKVNGMVVFRCLTDDGQLFGAAVKETEPDDVIMTTGQLVVMRAGTAERHDGLDRRFVEVTR
jgi:hypothetical protein